MDEFSTFARFPAAQPVRSDLNEVVTQALAVFNGRLDGISIRASFASELPPVNLDREQFQRVVVNLVDNAAEAMQESLLKKLYVLEDAMSPVAPPPLDPLPASLDFPTLAERGLAELREQGVNVVKTSEPIG